MSSGPASPRRSAQRVAVLLAATALAAATGASMPGLAVGQQAEGEATQDQSQGDASQGQVPPAPTAATPAGSGREADVETEVPDAAPLQLIVPDSELVYGPTLYGFDVESFVEDKGGYLGTYLEVVDGEAMYGPAVVERVAQDYSVGARVLLTLIEAHSGWVTKGEPAERDFPLDQPVSGLYDALSLTADQLNAAYYAHKYGGRRTTALADGSAVALTGTSSGTFAVFALTTRNRTRATWDQLEGPSRFYATFTALFGDPYRFDVADTIPADIPHVDPALPFRSGEVWFYTAGPRPPWGVGAARAAVDFSPPPESATGCFPSGSPVTAAAAGGVLWSRPSGVVVELDGDGYYGSGWTHRYLHTDSSGRIEPGKRVSAGDLIGYPSCEGGVSTQTRVSFARTYNGEWIPTDFGPAPLILGGWNVLAGPAAGEGWLARPGVPERVAGPTKSGPVNGVAALPGESSSP